ncbi:MAG: hypothetical protein KDA89_15745, partial [Planctomycetaceae bacterium]|nr:hypothetical protein [Planctomycetaceae bacterium]
MLRMSILCTTGSVVTGKPDVRTSQFSASSLVLVFAALLTAGCGSEPPSSATDASSSGAAPGQVSKTEVCRQKLAGAIRRFEPEQFSLQSSPERSVNGLNAWIKSCGAERLSSLSVSENAERFLDANSRRHIAAGVYTANDANYIRDCWMFRELTAAVVSGLSNDVTDQETREARRISAVFARIVRNISLLPQDAERVPLGLFDTLLVGQGTAEDRAWIFAEALRQLQTDAVVLLPSEPPAEEGHQLDTAQLLVSVLSEGRSFLYDMQGGIPVTAEGTTDVLTAAPADVSALKEHSRWKSPQVRIVARSAAFSPRMLVLQEQLAAEDASILYEELGGVSEIRPIAERVLNGSDGLWTEADIQVWDYPELRLTAAQSLPEKDRQAYSLLMRPFDAPFERSTLAAENIEELTAIPEQLSPEEKQMYVEQR